MNAEEPAALAERIARLSPAKRAKLEQALLDRQRAGVPQARPIPPRGPAGGPAPLSFAQRGLWFLDQWHPGGALSCATAVVRLTGPLDTGALRRAFAVIVARHDVLRTTFDTVDGQPVQLIRPRLELTIPAVDLRGLGRGERETAARALLDAQARRPFDLVNGPLLRARLLALGDGDAVLALSLHHIIADGWSLAVLAGEVSAGYAAFAAGRAPALPDLPIQFADYAIGQAHDVEHGDLRAQLEWWKSELAGSPPVLDLPADRPRPAAPSYQAGSLDVQVPADVAARLRSLCQREGATLFMALLAAIAVLLHRYTGRAGVIIGAPVAGRAGRDTEGLIGCFVNTLALRTDLSGDPTFTELLRRVRDSALAAYARQDAPFERLVEELRVERDTSYAPIFQVMFVLQNTPEPRWALPGVTARPMRVSAPAVRVDLSIEITDGGGSLAGTVDYSTDLFDAATVTRFVDHLGTLLAGIAATPGTRISDLTVLPAAERRRLVADWSTSAPAPAGPADPVRAFEAAVRRAPGAVAVTGGDQCLRYDELNGRANQVAHLLAARGVGAEGRVGICGEWSPELVVGLLGVLKAGGAFVPMDPGHPPSRLAFLREDCGVRIVLTQERWREGHGDAEVICLDGDQDRLAAQPRTDPVPCATAENLAYVVYTSGSTGRPKGVAVTRGNLASYCAAIGAILAGGPGGEPLSYGFLAALGTDLGNTAIFPALLTGGQLVLLPKDCGLDGRAFAAAVAERPLHVLKTTPTQIRALLASAPAAEVLPARWLVLGGEPLALTLWEELISARRCRVLNHYGPTEVTVGCVAYAPDRADAGRSAAATVPIGRPLAGLAAYVLDRGLRPVPIGVPGELCLAGAQVARGYLGRPGLTAERFAPNPHRRDGGRLYRTGDLARWTAHGVLEFLGRSDQQVKFRGYRIELGEIEAVLAEHPEVTAAAVTVWQPEAGDARLVAHVVGTVSPPDLLTFARTRLPAHQVPGSVRPLTALPLTPNGKLDRALLEQAASREPPRPPAATPVHAGEPAAELLQAIWAQVLRTDQVPADADFFAAGGHSLLAVQVVTRVNRAFGVELPVRALFEAPNLAAFARRVEDAGRAAPDLLPPIGRTVRTGPIPLSEAQQRLWYIDRLDRSGSVHIQSYALTLDGPLSVPAIVAAVACLRERHESLRTTFRSDRGVLEQVVADPAPVPVPLADLSALDEAQREAAAERLAKDDARAPFDLGRGPLLRVTVVRLRGDRHLLLLALHHIITDAWSAGLLFDELWEGYAARVRAAPARLPALGVQYPDYAIWEQRWLDDELALERAASYWRRQLAGAPELDLRYDRPLPMTPVFASMTVRYELPPDESGELAAFSLREGITPYIAVLTAYLIMLRLRSGQSDIVVGASTANRGRLETERVIGFFTNQLVLRADVPGELTARELLARVREVTLSAYAHSEMPFNRLVRILQLGRRLNRSPLYQAEIEFHRLTDQPSGPPGITVTRREVAGPAQTTMVDLSLHVVQTETVLRGGLAYNAEVFSPATATTMVGELRAILAEMVARPEAAVDEIAEHGERQGRRTAAEARALAARARFDRLVPGGR